jgi:hypothetical protein
MTWAADVVDVERYSKVGICFLDLARKMLLFLSRQEERRGLHPPWGFAPPSARTSRIGPGDS